MSASPICSIVIPSYRSAHTIGACLTALANQDVALPYEIIVVDSSPDETPDLVHRGFPSVELIRLGSQTDPAVARNIGARRAKGDVLAFIDSDCVAGPDWVRRLVTTLAEGYDGVGGSIANANGDSIVSWAGYFCEFREFLPGGPPRDVANLTLGNVAYRRSVFWTAGGFPAGAFPQEDQIFHHTLTARGCRLRLDPTLTVAHMHRTEHAAFVQHQRHIGRANARVVRQLRLPGVTLLRCPLLAHLAFPALVSLRFWRTFRTCWWVEHGLLLRQPTVAWLCWLGIWAWGRGFIEGAAPCRRSSASVMP